MPFSIFDKSKNSISSLYGCLNCEETLFFYAVNSIALNIAIVLTIKAEIKFQYSSLAEGMHLLIPLLVSSVLFSIAVNPLEEANFGNQKSKHPMSFAWSLHPLIGIFGTIINSFVLYMGYCERETFIRPVNAMIWYVHVKFTELCL